MENDEEFIYLRFFFFISFIGLVRYIVSIMSVINADTINEKRFFKQFQCLINFTNRRRSIYALKTLIFSIFSFLLLIGLFVVNSYRISLRLKMTSNHHQKRLNRMIQHKNYLKNKKSLIPRIASKCRNVFLPWLSNIIIYENDQ